MAIKIINALLTVIVGIGATLVLYWVLNKLATLLPPKWEHRVKPFAYILPAFAAVSLFLIYPAVQTIVASFANADTTAFVGLQNYQNLFASPDFVTTTLFNWLLWIAFAPIITIVVGLLVAVLTDRLRPRGEKTTKSIIFLPMAISAVGAGTIWRLVYAANPPGEPQVGLLNGIWTAFGNAPVAWLQISTLRLNTFLLMMMFLWAQVGFSMVLLSAAIKGVSAETLEAARIDGAGEVAVFFKIIVPQIWGTILTVYVTVMIGVMKLFDIVYVMTNGNFKTNVLGLQFFNELFTNFNSGNAAAIVVLMLVALIPILIFQVRNVRSEGALR